MNDEELVGSIAWFSGNNGPCCSGLTFGSKAVGQKAANALGLHDMSGNVWEWVNDWYSSSYYASSPAVNPPGPATGIFRVLRGGSWDYVSANLRSSTRNVLTPGHSGDHFGFRVARVP
jgi:formylglycine-generating enzyme required for sulfatase activity